MLAMVTPRIVAAKVTARASFARRSLAAGAACAVAATAAQAGAQEIQLTGPLIGCWDRPISVPTRFEWSYWIAGGGVLDAAPRLSGGAYGAAGAEITIAAVTYVGFPAHSIPPRLRTPEVRAGLRPYHDSVFGQLRAGAWAQAATRAAGALVEGGATVHVGTVADPMGQLFKAAPWGTFDLRAGAGYGAFPGERSPFVSFGLGWGYRFLTDRAMQGRTCDPVPAPVWSGEAKVARLVVTGRRSALGEVWEFGVGVEVSPTAVAPLVRSCGGA